MANIKNNKNENIQENISTDNENEIFILKNLLSKMEKELEEIKNTNSYNMENTQAVSKDSSNVNESKDNEEYTVISMFPGRLGVTPKMGMPQFVMEFQEIYTIHGKENLEDFYRLNKEHFINNSLIFESPSVFNVLRIKNDQKNALNISTYNNLGNLDTESLKITYLSCNKLQQEMIVDKFVEEGVKGTPGYVNQDKLELLGELHNIDINKRIYDEKNPS